jgi:hypothetical protein
MWPISFIENWRTIHIFSAIEIGFYILLMNIFRKQIGLSQTDIVRREFSSCPTYDLVQVHIGQVNEIGLAAQYDNIRIEEI